MHDQNQPGTTEAAAFTSHRLRSFHSGHMPALASQPDATALPASFKIALTRVWTATGIFEWVAISYLALSSAMVAAFSHNLAHPWKLLAAQAIVTTIIFLLCAAYACAESRAQLTGVTLSTYFWHFWR